MIDPRKMINKRMTTEDLSLLYLAGDILQFKDNEQFEFWLFVLNFPLIKPYIKPMVTKPPGHPLLHGHVTVIFDLPFCLGLPKQFDSGRFTYTLGYSEEHLAHVIDALSIRYSYPEARLLIRATR